MATDTQSNVEDEAMMEQMMKQCCGESGKPDFNKMKQFMQQCGKQAFSADEMEKMGQFCSHEGMPDFTKMMEFMKGCGCNSAGEIDRESTGT